MAIDKVKLQKFFDSLEKEYGEGSISDMDGMLKIERWSTGMPDLDAILGGGMPKGRIVEIFGAESAGKTSLLNHLMAQHEMAVLIPIEGSYSAERASIFGNRKGQLKVRRAYTAEQCMETINNVIECGIPIVGVDSVPAMKVKKEFEEEDIEKETQPARTAAFLSNNLPKTNHIVEKHGATLIFINQLRDAMNKTFFMPDDHTPGGRALKFFCSIRLKVSRKSSIEIPNKDPRDTNKNKEVGIIIKCKVVKSKIHNPKGECEIPLFFDRGFVSFEDIEPIRKELMEAQRNKHKQVETTESEEETEENVENHIKPISTAEAKERLKSMTKKKKKG